MPRSLECVLIGHNEGDFEKRVREARHQQTRSGVYEDVKANSVLLDGRRVKYMELLDHAVADRTGRQLGLSVFRVPHLGACYLASALARHGIAVELVNSYRDDLTRLRALLADGPGVVAITTTYYVDDEPIREIVDRVRAEAPDTLIVVGGPRVYSIYTDHDELTQDYLFEHSLGADVYITDSQGEGSLVALLQALRDGRAALDRVPNLVYRQGGGEWRRTARQAENNQLEANAVEWSRFAPDFIRPIVALRTARSCPYSCSFCNYPTMAGAHVVAGVDAVERELRWLHEAGVKYINFIDDTFNVPLPRFKAMLRMMIRSGFQFQWSSFLRCGNTDDETFDLMREAGCVAVLLGIESGDERMLIAMNKKASVERYRYGIGRLNAAGIASFASLIVGFPGETADSVRRTMAFIEDTSPTFFNPQLYFHDKQSPIHRRAADFGLRGAGYAWSHEGMTWREAASWVEATFRDVTGSTPLTLDGFSMWAFTYLLQHGIDIAGIQRFGDAARPLLLAGFAEQSVARGSAPYAALVASVDDAAGLPRHAAAAPLRHDLPIMAPGATAGGLTTEPAPACGGAAHTAPVRFVRPGELETCR
jgi:radical SAM PhpK family P-methyltransferase